MPILLAHVSKSFARKAEAGGAKRVRERRQVLKDVNLKTEVGEVTCLLGRNGSGKTTLIRIISTLIEPDGGEVRVCGFDTVNQAQHVRRRLGVVLNAGDGGFSQRLSSLTNLEYYAALYQIPMRRARERIKQLLHEFGLSDHIYDQYQSYSSGMRRRLALVRALLPDAPVLLLDEPTLGVDPWSTELIHKRLLDLSSQGKTIICATNSVSEARAIGTRTMMLEEGMLSEAKNVEVGLV